ncbi:response regulator transcription factor [Alkalicoccus halolimnae]|uniref:Response regulator transcription factor n=1 Tax=Alkalicoccus halolimnae TaxID=1667239 RepID=A0A5C7FG51_9BACI|nr:response regulator transcription factor [Alkalicoccus halolimnae]TXF83566.1 response regulator transcription factor [Alkalicoccus halolimnae]
MRPYRVLLAEDQTIVRQGLKMMMEEAGTFRVVEEAADGREAVKAAHPHAVDLVVLDIRMPVMTGLEAARDILKNYPDLPVLMLTTFDDDEYALEALSYGAKGYMLKDADASRLLLAMTKAVEGGISLDEGVAGRIVPKLMGERPVRGPDENEIPLTKREVSIAALIGEGKSNQEIAAELFLSVGTVKNHISVILDKLELRDRTQLAIYALKNRLV